ncbi:MAG TPA: hypothetical protein VGJ28_05750, partial [Micromonosporaceae bacterium]
RELVALGRQVISYDAPGVGQPTGYTLPRRMPGWPARSTGWWPPWATGASTHSACRSAARSRSNSRTGRRGWSGAPESAQLVAGFLGADSGTTPEPAPSRR